MSLEVRCNALSHGPCLSVDRSLYLAGQEIVQEGRSSFRDNTENSKRSDASCLWSPNDRGLSFESLLFRLEPVQGGTLKGSRSCDEL